MATERLQRQIERLLDEAEEAVSQLDWTSVRDRAQAVLAFDPGNEDAKGFLAASERALGGPGVATTAPAASSPTVYASSPPSAAQPTSFANGRYEVKRFLGEGGKKKVYLAQDTLLDREAAMSSAVVFLSK